MASDFSSQMLGSSPLSNSLVKGEVLAREVLFFLKEKLGDKFFQSLNKQSNYLLEDYITQWLNKVMIILLSGNQSLEKNKENSYTYFFRDNLKRPQTVIDGQMIFSIKESELYQALIKEHVVLVSLSQGLSERFAALIYSNIELIINDVNYKEFHNSSQNSLERVEASIPFLEENDKAWLLLRKRLDNLLEDCGDTAEEALRTLSLENKLEQLFNLEKGQKKLFEIVNEQIIKLLEWIEITHFSQFHPSNDMLTMQFSEYNDNHGVDEALSIQNSYYTREQLEQLRLIYDKELSELALQVERFFKRIEKITHPFLARFLKSRKREEKHIAIGSFEWYQLHLGGVVLQGKETVHKKNDTQILHELLRIARENLNNSHLYNFSRKKVILLKAVESLEYEVSRFNEKLNPYHISHGLVVQANFSTIKHRRYTEKSCYALVQELVNRKSSYINETIKGAIRSLYNDFKSLS